MTLARDLIDRPLDRTNPAGRRVTVNRAESPLSWLRSRGFVSERHYAAGEQLRLDFERAGLGPSVTMRWDASGVKTAPRAKGGMTPNARQLTARRRFDGALAHAGTGLADILWRSVCVGETLPDAERALGWPNRSGRLVLTLALDRVADYYRLS